MSKSNECNRAMRKEDLPSGLSRRDQFLPLYVAISPHTPATLELTSNAFHSRYCPAGYRRLRGHRRWANSPPISTIEMYTIKDTISALQDFLQSYGFSFTRAVEPVVFDGDIFGSFNSLTILVDFIRLEDPSRTSSNSIGGKLGEDLYRAIFSHWVVDRSTVIS